VNNKIVLIVFLTVISFTANLTYAAGGKVTDPSGIAPDRYVYYPGTEALNKKEIRIGDLGCIK
jgi:ribonuclease Z